MMIVDGDPVRGICDPPGPTDYVHDDRITEAVNYDKTKVTDYHHTREQDGAHTYQVKFTVPEEFNEAELSQAIQLAVDNLTIHHRLIDMKKNAGMLFAEMLMGNKKEDNNV